MTRIRHALRRMFAKPADSADAGIHFHRRSDAPEVCYDEACRLPRLSV